MYPDPKKVRDHRITIRLDDYEFAFFISLVTLLVSNLRRSPVAFCSRKQRNCAPVIPL